MKQRVGSLKKISKTDKSFYKITKRQRGNMQINKIRRKRGDITIDTKEIQKIIKNLYNTQLENLKMTDKFLNRFHLP